jgi:adenine-specific DNA-methyltransferase
MLIVTTMTIEKLRPTYTFTQERLAALQAVVPEAFADGRINWEHLRAALGDYLEEEGADAEPFGLSWPGKRAARRLAATPSHGTLIPAPGQGIDEATTRNLFLEGDNLEVLKLLQKSYAGRVKLIYIDPPYNTGNDFIYKDDFSEPLTSYLRRTGQTGEEGELLTTNPKAGGRFHSNWLNMMYSRLLLARQLLHDDGLIFISIDDNEISNLRAVMDELFGTENFVAVVIIQSNKRGQTYNEISKTHEYVVIYARSDEASIYELPKLDGALPFQDAKGTFDLWELRNRNPKFGRHNRPNLFFPIYVCPEQTDSNGYAKIALSKSNEYRVEVVPKNSEGKDSCWRWSKDAILKEDIVSPFAVVVARQKQNGEWNIYEKSRKNTTKAKSIWSETDVISEQGTIALGELGLASSFDHPKPVGLLTKILQISTQPDDLILDFFSGSSTTAQAIFQLNREDGGDRRFILVQLPEPTNNPQFPTIAEIGKERIRRVIGRMKQEAAGKLLSERETPEDLGFKVFTLGRSHFKAWSAEAVQPQAEDLGALPTLFDAAESPLVDNWQPDDLLVEILLQEGFPLDSRITVLEFYQQNWVWQVESAACAHRLFVCLDERLHAATIAGAARISNGIFICLDTALSDEEKLRLADQCRLKVI